MRIDDKLLSKTQAHIKCNDSEQWVATDGYNGKQSTNGTWIYLNEDFEVYDGVSFKANQTIFTLRIIQPPKGAVNMGGTTGIATLGGRKTLS